jgi:hypothetical protein
VYRVPTVVEKRTIAAPEAPGGVARRALVGGKVSTRGRRGRPWSIRESRRPAAWELSVCIIEQRNLTHHVFSSLSLSQHAHLVTIGSMSQPVVQTIHRDPALLYVSAWLATAQHH